MARRDDIPKTDPSGIGDGNDLGFPRQNRMAASEHQTKAIIPTSHG